MSHQLQHFAPIMLTDRVVHGNLMEQCFIQISPVVRELQNLSIPGHTQDLTKVDLDSVLLSQAKTKRAQRKSNIESFAARISQVCKIEYIGHWNDFCCISRDYFLLRNDKRKLSILTKFWQLWKLWWNSKSILVNVRSKIVLISKVIIFNKCFQFWK